MGFPKSCFYDNQHHIQINNGIRIESRFLTCRVPQKIDVGAAIFSKIHKWLVRPNKLCRHYKFDLDAWFTSNKLSFYVTKNKYLFYSYVRYPVGHYLFRINNGNIRTLSEVVER